MQFSHFNNDLYKLWLYELLVVLLMGAGVLAPVFSFSILALMIVFFLTKPLKESMGLFFLSLPFFVALPITRSFDTMSLWRPLSLALVLLWFWERRQELWHRPLAFWEAFLRRKDLLYLTMAGGAFLFMATISLLWARDTMLGVKTIIYFANIFAILFVFAWELTKEDIPRFLSYACIVSAVSLLIGFGQFASTFVVSLHQFWHWWAFFPIYVYYGSDTSDLMHYSNTWFSYYGDDPVSEKPIPATLRMFSFLQDSHSFAMLAILTIAAWGAFFLFFRDQQDKKGMRLVGAVGILSLLAVILSGSRGSWAAALAMIIGVFACMQTAHRFHSLSLSYLKPAFVTLVIFFLLFPISSVILGLEQKAQLIIEGRAGELDLGLTFFRARSTFDFGELSNKGRLEIWRDSLIFLTNNYFIKGTGIGNFPTVLDLRPEKTRMGASAHSLYLQFLVELGIVGLLFFLAILLLILHQAYKLATRSGPADGLSPPFAFAFLFGFAWVLIYSAVDVTLMNDKVLLMSSILIALLYAKNKKSLASQ